MELIVSVEYDDEARVWFAQNDTLGLATEADTMEVLTYKLQEMIPELVELNRIDVPLDAIIKSRHTANAVLRQAGLPKTF
jgi:hypothetical protein